MELPRQHLEAGDVEEGAARDALEHAGEQLLAGAGLVTVDVEPRQEPWRGHEGEQYVQGQHGGQVQLRLQQVQTYAEWDYRL